MKLGGKISPLKWTGALPLQLCQRMLGPNPPFSELVAFGGCRGGCSDGIWLEDSQIGGCRSGCSDGIWLQDSQIGWCLSNARIVFGCKIFKLADTKVDAGIVFGCKILQLVDAKVIQGWYLVARFSNWLMLK